MSDFSGKTAVISGGAEGIGFSIATALGKQGMKLVLGDINPGQLEKAKAALEEEGVEVLAVELDVAQPAQWQALAEQAVTRFGKIHMLVNNAGVGGKPGTIEETDSKDWEWVLDVNLLGVIYGTQTIIPLIKSHGEGGWLINTASMAGMMGVPMAQAYTATKVAVVGMSESWFAELKPQNIHVSVLCPAFVKTRINLSHRNKPERYQGDATEEEATPLQSAISDHMQQVIDRGLDVEVVGQRVVEALKAKELYIFTHPNYRILMKKRFAEIDAAFERAAKSPLLEHVLDMPIEDFS